jgi:hypothetical protein
MIPFLAALAFMFILIYFLSRRLRDSNWQEFRQRRRESAQRRRERADPSAPEKPIDPNFQFDETPDGGDAQQK